MQKPFKLSHPLHFLALGFGSGLLKPAPGTWGSLVGLGLMWPCALVLGTSSASYLVLVLLVAVSGIYICGWVADDVGEHDHAAIVWDEIAGIFVTFCFVPVSPITVLLGFLLFRLFDILKPWPIGWADRQVHGGLGIMLDDLIAGLMSAICLWLLNGSNLLV